MQLSTSAQRLRTLIRHVQTRKDWFVCVASRTTSGLTLPTSRQQTTADQGMADEVTRKVFSLYEEGGQQPYQGDAVTQLEHAVQCAMLAEASGQPTQVILGALLHDVGHLIKSQGQGQMGKDGLALGVDRHDKLGADFLEGLGVPSTICSISRRHIDAKRYLCHTDTQYYNSLSETSRLNLQVHQGGAMTTAEAAQFEQDPDCQSILLARRWDDASKVANLQCQPLSRYRAMFHKYMEEILQAR